MEYRHSLYDTSASNKSSRPRTKKWPEIWARLSMGLRTKIKTHILRASYWLAYRLAAPVVYTRHPFARYPYMSRPSELLELTKQLLSVKEPGAVVEVGCHQGWTTCFLVEALKEQGVKRNYVCIDTFNGFTPQDARFEYEVRGKSEGLYDDFFLISDPAWLKASMSRFGYTNVTVIKTDAATFNYLALGQIAFAWIDVDLYRPVRASLERILPNMARGGVVMVDDCNASDDHWNGAYEAYIEACKDHNIKPTIVSQKFGIIYT